MSYQVPADYGDFSSAMYFTRKFRIPMQFWILFGNNCFSVYSGTDGYGCPYFLTNNFFLDSSLVVKWAKDSTLRLLFYTAVAHAASCVWALWVNFVWLYAGVCFNSLLHLLFRFAILDPTRGGGGLPPPAYSPLIAMELRNKDEWKVWDVLNPTIPDIDTLGHILTFTGQVEWKHAGF